MPSKAAINTKGISPAKLSYRELGRKIELPISYGGI
jgi:hypothetical protein